LDLQVRVSAPVTGSELPVILLSHGHGPSNHLSSLNGYAPLANYWAAHGFAVIQPTHLDSKTLVLREADDPEAPGRGGDALSEFAAEHYSFFSTMDFSEMRTPALVVAGDKDASPHLTVQGPEWHTDPYFLSPGPKDLLTLFGAEHGLGGVAGYDAAETTDEDPERVAAVQRLTSAYLRTELYPGDPAWQAACDELAASPNPPGRVESR
jgi:predicted dienelactone hydrolase